VNPGEAGRGGKGAASGGGTERRSLLSEPSERSARGQQSREAKPTASADRRAKRERSWSAGEQGGGERAWFEERRRRGTRRRAPENLASVPSGDSERVASRPFFGRLATIKRAVEGGPERPVSKRRSAVEPTREGAFPPYYCCAGRRLTNIGEKRVLARFLRPCPEATESERKGDGPV